MGQVYETPGVPRWNAFVARLPDGRVLVAGGEGHMFEDPTPTPTNRSAELYDPTTDTWASLPDMPEARAGGAALDLIDGSVLLVGGHAQRAPCGPPPFPACGLDPSTQRLDHASAIRLFPRHDPSRTTQGQLIARGARCCIDLRLPADGRRPHRPSLVGRPSSREWCVVVYQDQTVTDARDAPVDSPPCGTGHGATAPHAGCSDRPRAARRPRP